MNRARNAGREPTLSGGSVFQSMASILAYQCGALSGSAAREATSATGLSITIEC